MRTYQHIDSFKVVKLNDYSHEHRKAKWSKKCHLEVEELRIKLHRVREVAM